MSGVRLPPKLVDVFDGEAMFRGAFGGRGSAAARANLEQRILELTHERDALRAKCDEWQRAWENYELW